MPQGEGNAQRPPPSDQRATAVGEERRRIWGLVRAGISIVIVGAAFLGVLPRIADLGEVWRVVRGLTWAEVAVLAALSAWNIFTYWPMLAAAMPGLSLGQAAVVCQSSTSVAMTLPGGGAIAVGVSYAMYTSWGFGPSDIALATLLTGIVNLSFKFVLPVISLAVLAINGEWTGELLSTALAGAGVVLLTFAVLAEMIRREDFAYRVGTAVGGIASFCRRLVRMSPVDNGGDVAVRFRSKLIRVLRNRGLLLAGAEVASQLSLYLVLLAALRFVGVPDATVSWAKVLAVFAFVRLGTVIPIVPGNVGIVELGYIGGLVLAGAPRSEVVAAVLVFRFLTYFVQIPIGGVTYLFWRRRHSWLRARPALSQDHSAGDAGEVDQPSRRHSQPGLVDGRADRQDEEPAVPSS